MFRPSQLIAPQLHRLVADQAEFSDASLATLAQHCRDLHYLSLNHGESLTDEGLSAIATFLLLLWQHRSHHPGHHQSSAELYYAGGDQLFCV